MYIDILELQRKGEALQGSKSLLPSFFISGAFGTVIVMCSNFSWDFRSPYFMLISRSKCKMLSRMTETRAIFLIKWKLGHCGVQVVKVIYWKHHSRLGRGGHKTQPCSSH